jgi:hypothetical protein
VSERLFPADPPVGCTCRCHHRRHRVRRVRFGWNVTVAVRALESEYDRNDAVLIAWMQLGHVLREGGCDIVELAANLPGEVQ